MGRDQRLVDDHALGAAVEAEAKLLGFGEQLDFTAFVADEPGASHDLPLRRDQGFAAALRFRDLLALGGALGLELARAEGAVLRGVAARDAALLRASLLGLDVAGVGVLEALFLAVATVRGVPAPLGAAFLFRARHGSHLLRRALDHDLQEARASPAVLGVDDHLELRAGRDDQLGELFGTVRELARGRRELGLAPGLAHAEDVLTLVGHAQEERPGHAGPHRDELLALRRVRGVLRALGKGEDPLVVDGVHPLVVQGPADADVVVEVHDRARRTLGGELDVLRVRGQVCGRHLEPPDAGLEPFERRTSQRGVDLVATPHHDLRVVHAPSAGSRGDDPPHVGGRVEHRARDAAALPAFAELLGLVELGPRDPVALDRGTSVGRDRLIAGRHEVERGAAAEQQSEKR